MSIQGKRLNYTIVAVFAFFTVLALWNIQIDDLPISTSNEHAQKKREKIW